ncbi:putative Phenylalanyl-tRNA synthetase beta chain [Glarea lozoyensis 74030]|uniref:Phenylalanine--tRNA ligase beta subunit n=1 Tax=Glarea lozoyensis (strain ATCC 74030 / MF5533) TaxID=1104152 RepID=H0EYW7_GLAL7|nr:putative Phenylalanyl-tRNA synthetase beta chain [Glarea lozoyensis 74030]
MPTISVDKAELYKALGQEYTTEEFETLCFEFGIELDEDTSNIERPIVNGKQEPPQLKIEIPANRYDMLCFEGIALMLNVFREKTPFPNYRLVEPKNGKLETITVHPDTAKNLARQRTLVAIGTHDLDTIQGPFTYEALPPKYIKFAPLNQTTVMSAEELMQHYENDKHLGRYLHIIRDKPVYPVIYDSQRRISLNTTNVFIEMTGTDRTKLEIVNNIIVAMFSQYCAEPFTIEPVQIVSDHNGETRQTPNISPRKAEAEIDYINNCCGLSESPESICKLLQKMCLSATPSTSDKNILDVSIPPTRADVLHQCDIMEDVAIGYGFNNLPRTSPNKSSTIAQPLLVNKLGDIVRMEAAMAGWSEVMPLILCSHDENFAWLNRKDDGTTAVRLANPKTAEYQIVRTSLLPGLLKTVRENKKHSVPIKVFEVSDVAFKDLSLERKSRNERHFAAAWYDRVLLMLKTAFLTNEEGLEARKGLNYEVREDHTKVDGYWIEEINEETFFQGHAAAIFLRVDGKAVRIGEFGILHPTVLEKFELRYPVSTLEINLEVFL